MTLHLRFAPLAGSLGALVLFAFVACGGSAVEPSDDAGEGAAIDASRSPSRPPKQDAGPWPWPAWATSFTAVLLVSGGESFDRHHPVHYALEPDQVRVDVPLSELSWLLQNDQGTFFAALDAWRMDVKVFDAQLGSMQTFETPENSVYQPLPNIMHVAADGAVFYHDTTPQGEIRVRRNHASFAPLGTRAIACRDTQCVVSTEDPARTFTIGDGPTLAVEGATGLAAWNRSGTCMIAQRETDSVLRCSDGSEHTLGDRQKAYLHPTRKLVVQERGLWDLQAYDFDAAPEGGGGGLQPAPGRAVFDPTGTRLYTFGRREVSVYDATGPLRLIGSFPAPGPQLGDVNFGRGGTTFVTFSPADSFPQGPALYVLRDDGLTAVATATQYGNVHVDFSPAGSRALIGVTSYPYGETEVALLWDVASGSVLRRWDDGAPSDWRWLDETRAWLAFPLKADGWSMHLLDGTTVSEESIELASGVPHLGTHFRFVKARRSSTTYDTRIL